MEHPYHVLRASDNKIMSRFETLDGAIAEKDRLESIRREKFVIRKLW
jgi:hypothetical protein